MLLALLLTVFSFAAEPRCPGGAKSTLVLHPFRPVHCEGAQDVSLSTATPKQAMKASPEHAAAILKRLEGDWEGWEAFGMERYEVRFKLAGTKAALTTKEHRTLRQWRFEADVTPGRGQEAKIKTRLLEWPTASANGTVRFGAAEAPYDFEAVLSDSKGASLLIRFKRKGDELTVWFRDLRRPAIEANETTLRRRLQAQ